MVPDEGGSPSRARPAHRFEAPRVDPAAVMAETLVAMHADGIELKDVLCDCGYSNRHPATFSKNRSVASGRAS